MERRQTIFLYVLFLIALTANIAFWRHSYPLHGRWINVPPAPTEDRAMAMALGDQQFAYRVVGFLLQNFGNGGGQSTALKDYDYSQLGQWFTTADKLDPISEYVPDLAAFYFGATQNAKQLPAVIDYLAVAGSRPQPEKWRWLAQAVYLARFRLGDMNRALTLSNALAKTWKPGMPAWVLQAPGFIMTAKGDKKTALDFMLAVLKAEPGKVSQPEINSTIAYICQSILSREERYHTQLCIENESFMNVK